MPSRCWQRRDELPSEQEIVVPRPRRAAAAGDPGDSCPPLRLVAGRTGKPPGNATPVPQRRRPSGIRHSRDRIWVTIRLAVPGEWLLTPNRRDSMLGQW